MAEYTEAEARACLLAMARAIRTGFASHFSHTYRDPDAVLAAWDTLVAERDGLQALIRWFCHECGHDAECIKDGGALDESKCQCGVADLKERMDALARPEGMDG
jgi:hypothetical protein